jgi:hypothetical protein
MAAWSRCTTLSAQPATVRLPANLDGQAPASEVRQVLGDPGHPHSTGQEIALSGYGFRWLRLLDENPATPPE